MHSIYKDFRLSTFSSLLLLHRTFQRHPYAYIQNIGLRGPWDSLDDIDVEIVDKNLSLFIHASICGLHVFDWFSIIALLS